jgi:hypothetical protein
VQGVSIFFKTRSPHSPKYLIKAPRRPAPLPTEAASEEAEFGFGASEVAHNPNELEQKYVAAAHLAQLACDAATSAGSAIRRPKAPTAAVLAHPACTDIERTLAAMMHSAHTLHTTLTAMAAPYAVRAGQTQPVTRHRLLQRRADFADAATLGGSGSIRSQNRAPASPGRPAVAARAAASLSDQPASGPARPDLVAPAAPPRARLTSLAARDNPFGRVLD